MPTAKDPPEEPAVPQGTNLLREACPLCSGELTSRGTDGDRGLSRCEGCNTRFELSSLARLGARPEEAPPIQRRQVDMPSFTKVQRGDGRLQIRLRFFTWLTGFMAFGLTIILAVVVLSTFAPGGEGWTPQGAMQIAIGLAVSYILAVQLVNTRWVDLTPELLSVRVGPLPWPGRMNIRAADFKQLYCRIEVHEDGEGDRYSYEVHAILKNHRRVELLKGLNTLDQALWVEQEIEKFLGIRDALVVDAAGSWSAKRAE